MEKILPFSSLQAQSSNTQIDKSLYAAQYELEELYFKNNIMRRVKEDFATDFKIMFIIEKHNLNKDFAVMFLVHAYLRKQSNPSTLIGCLLPYADGDLELCARWIEDCVDADLANYNPTRNRIIFIYEVSEEIQHDLELYQYHLPMITEPLTVVNNTDTGYLSLPPSFVVTNRKPDNGDYCLEVINLLNKIPMFINPDVALGIKNTWKNCYQKPGESAYDFKLKEKALKRYNTHAKDIINHYVNNDFKVYFSNFYDMRGRIYPRGYYLNPQGNQWNKASLNLTPQKVKKGKSTDRLTPLGYLKADIANNFGFKGTWEEKVDWFDTNEAILDTLITSASDPALFFAGITAYADVKAGKPTGYMPTFDASASGLQFLAILCGCEISAYHCNVIASGFCQDAYTNVYNILMTDYQTIQGLTRKQLKNAVMTALYGSIQEPTNIFVDPIFVDDFFRCLSNMLPGAWNLNQTILGLWNPKALDHSWTMPDNFNVKIPVINKVKYLVNAFDLTHEVIIKENLPKDTSRSLGPNIIHSIDSFVLREMVRRCSGNYPSKLAERIVSFKTGNYKDPTNIRMVKTLWELYEKSGFLSARILDHIDNYTNSLVDMKVIRKFIKTLPKESFEIVCIHDAYRCHPNNVAVMLQQYNQLLHETAKSDLLCYIVNQFHGVHHTMEKGNLNPDDILNAEYALS